MTKKRKINIKMPKEMANPTPTVDIQNKDFGSLRLTTLQFPEVEKWQNGQEYDLHIRVRQVGSRERQDTKWDAKSSESKPIGKPYYENEFKIVSVSSKKS